MAGHGRSKNGVASLAYVPAIPLRQAPRVPVGMPSKLGLAQVLQVKYRRKSGKLDLR